MVPDNGHLSGNANDGEHADSDADAVGGGGGNNYNHNHNGGANDPVAQDVNTNETTVNQAEVVNYGAIQAMIMEYWGQTMKIESPTEYGSATDTSLESDNGGPWRMFVPEFNSMLDDMEEENGMLIDHDRWPTAGMIETYEDGLGDAELHNEDLAIIEWTPPVSADYQGTYLGSVLTNYDSTNSGLLNMVVDQVLSQPHANNAEVEPAAVISGAHARDTRRSKNLKRHRTVSIKETPKPKVDEAIQGGGISAVRAHLERVVAEVAKAVNTLPHTIKNKKIKKSISMAAEQVRDFTSQLEESSKVEGMLLTEGKAVVILSSDSSDGSEGRGTKRKSRATSDWERSTAVSSRLRGKTANKTLKAAEIVKKAQKRKLMRIPIRKVRAGHSKVSTALTLAPQCRGPTSNEDRHLERARRYKANNPPEDTGAAH